MPPTLPLYPSLPFPLPLSLLLFPSSFPPSSLPQVLAAVRGDDPHDQLAIAYQLVWDNRVLQKVLSLPLDHLDVATHPGSNG